AKSLRAIVNDSAILGRIGGDEFLVYVEGDNVVDTCVLYANKICKMFADIEQEDTKKLNLTCSVGISVYPNDGINYETLIRKADQALYDSKRHGKSKYCFYSEATTNDFCASLISKIDGETK
ncbi:MAG: GGDEF domain-containing protein, partial [Clostridia bacterium]